MRPMIRRRTLACAIVFGFLSLVRADPRAVGARPPAVHALFDLGAPDAGPFPSDWFTVADRSHNTGRRVNLPPLPDCRERVSDCEDLNVINTLDGFNLQPRLSIPFDRPIDVKTVTSKTVFLIGLGRTLRRDNDDDNDGDHDDDDEDSGLRVIGINQVVWDKETNTLHVGSNDLLDQHTRYALIVTSGIRDASGARVGATETFRRFRQTVRGAYKQALLEAIHAARHLGVREGEIAVASVFTTQSVTAVLEKIRNQIKAATPESADFLLGPNGTRTVFRLNGGTRMTVNQQTHVEGPLDSPMPVAIQLLNVFPGAVSAIAFGKYNSADYEVHPGEFIPPVGTRTGTPAVQGTNEIYFNLVLPSGTPPGGGWPVAIFGHGVTSNKNAALVRVAGSMAHHGIATIAINAVGHGFGPRSTLTVVEQLGSTPVTFLAGGRGIAQNGDQLIDADEGFSTAPPRTILLFTDGHRQTVADLMQLVRVIEVGMDVDGNGVPDLDPSHIYYLGNSLGGNFGTAFLAVEPSVRAGVFSSAGTIIENRRLSPGGRQALGQLLASRIPSLINAPGITSLDGVSVGQPPYFNENFPLRDGLELRVQLAGGTSQDIIQSPVINTVGGAMEIQQFVDNVEWVFQSGNSVAYAPYLRKTPLAGVPAKSVIYQFAKGDLGAPNPNMTAMLRAGDLADRATFYRHDLAYAEYYPRLQRNPHGFVTIIENEAFKGIALGAQEQIAVFFATDGGVIIHPEPVRFFELPIMPPLPEALNYIP